MLMGDQAPCDSSPGAAGLGGAAREAPGAAATARGPVPSAANPSLAGRRPGRWLPPSFGNCLPVWSTLGCKDPRDVLSVELRPPSKPLCPKLAEGPKVKDTDHRHPGLSQACVYVNGEIRLPLS